MLYLLGLLVIAVIVASVLWAMNESKKDKEAALRQASFDPIPTPARTLSRHAVPAAPPITPAAGAPFQPKAAHAPVRPHVPGTSKYGSPRTPARQEPQKSSSSSDDGFVYAPILYTDPSPVPSPEPTFHGGGGHFGGAGASGGHDSPSPSHSHDSGSSSHSHWSSSHSHDSGGGGSHNSCSSHSSCSSSSSCGGGGGGGD